MKITAIADSRLVNCNYRVYQPLMAVGRGGHDVTANRVGSPRFDPTRLRGSDVVLIHRFVDLELLRTLRALKADGVGIVWDNDDDIIAIPRSSPLHRRARGLNRVAVTRGLRDMVRLADVVTTPSEQLAERYRELGAGDVRVLPNCVADHFLNVQRRPHDGVVVGWLAGREHLVDYEQMRLKEVFVDLLERRPDIRLASIGTALGIASDRYHHVALLRWLNELAPAIAGFDIGLAPLVDIPFNRARSDIKLKEYAAVGVPWLASPVGPYSEYGAGQGGLLVSDGDWGAAIEALVDNQRQRRKLVKQGRKWVRGETISNNAHRWLEVFETAVAKARATRAVA